MCAWHALRMYRDIKKRAAQRDYGRPILNAINPIRTRTAFLPKPRAEGHSHAEDKAMDIQPLLGSPFFYLPSLPVCLGVGFQPHSLRCIHASALKPHEERGNKKKRPTARTPARSNSYSFSVLPYNRPSIDSLLTPPPPPFPADPPTHYHNSRLCSLTMERQNKPPPIRAKHGYYIVREHLMATQSNLTDRKDSIAGLVETPIYPGLPLSPADRWM